MEKNSFFLQTSVKYDIAALIMLKCHFIVMAFKELTSVREVIISAESVREVIISAESVREVIISADERL
jgi:hypothetical protein